MVRFPGKELLRSVILKRVRTQLNCALVLSTGRVGTVTLTELLNESPSIAADHEPHPMFLEETKIAYERLEAGANLAESFLNARLFWSENSSLKRAYRNGLLFVETSNRMTYMASSLAEYFPRSKFIFLHRNPADVIRSAMRRQFYNKHPSDSTRITPRIHDPYYAKWPNMTSFEKCCWYWKAINREILDFSETLPQKRIFQLPSSAVYQMDFSKLDRLFEWLGAEAPSRQQTENVLSIKHNAQEQGEFPKWTDWNFEKRKEMSDIVSDEAKLLGYNDYIVEDLSRC